MMLFLFFLTIIYFENIFDFDYTMQDIDNWLGYSILVGFAYKMMGVEPIFRFS